MKGLIVVRLQKRLHYFVGVGAVFGGLGAVLNPMDPMGIGTEALKKGPFESFLLPGLFLLFFLGMGNLLAGWTMRYRWWYSGYISGTLAVAMILWIVIQCYILQVVSPLHVIFFAIGVTQGLLALRTLVTGGIFPFGKIQRMQ